MTKKNRADVDATKVYSEEVGVIPEDITLFSPEQLRTAHAYWTSCHNQSSATLAVIQQKVKELKRTREVLYKTLFLQNKEERQSNEVARYNAELDYAVQDLDNRLNGLEQHEIIWNSLVTQCDYNRMLLSRDQSWRQEELSTYYGRGGQ